MFAAQANEKRDPNALPIWEGFKNLNEKYAAFVAASEKTAKAQHQPTILGEAFTLHIMQNNFVKTIEETKKINDEPNNPSQKKPIIIAQEKPVKKENTQQQPIALSVTTKQFGTEIAVGKDIKPFIIENFFKIEDNKPEKKSDNLSSKTTQATATNANEFMILSDIDEEKDVIVLSENDKKAISQNEKSLSNGEKKPITSLKNNL